MSRVVRLRPSWLIVVGVLVSVGLGLTGCAVPQAAQTPAGAVSPAAASVAVPFTAQTVAGAKVTVPGSKPTVVYFFAVGCSSCGPTAKVLADVQSSTAQKVDYVAVDVSPDETGPQVEAFLSQYHATSMAYALDTNAGLIDAYGVQDLGTAIVLDGSGKVVFRGVEPSAGQIRDVVAKASA